MLASRYLRRVALLVLSLTTAASIAHATSPTLDGIYILDAKASDDIDKALEAALDSSAAAAYLKMRHPAYAQTKIAHDDKEVVVTFDNGNPMRMPINGAVVPWTREDGKILQIKGQWTTTKLIQSIDTRDTLRVNEFSLSADGNTLTIKVDFSGYPKPLLYQLVYRRQ